MTGDAKARGSRANWIEAASKGLDDGLDELRGSTDGGLAIEPLYEPFPAESPIQQRRPKAMTTTLAYRHWDYRRVCEELARDGAENCQAWVTLDRSTRIAAPHRGGEAIHVGVAGTIIANATELAKLAEASAVPIVLDPGANLTPVAALVETCGHKGGIAVAFDPLGSWARDGMLPSSFHDLYREARDLHPLVVVSTLPYHDAGCDEVMEVAFALATAAEYVRELGAEDDVFRSRLGFRVGVGTNVFVEVAKLRALRWTWSKLARASGNNNRADLHAVASLRGDSMCEPWTNSLRCTASAVVAQLAGADSFCPHAFDELSHQPSQLGRRIARNTAAVLTREGQLARVWDPCAGSGYVETLTEQIARAAWERFRAIESSGGMTAALAEGRIKQEVDASWDALQNNTRESRVLVGVNRFQTGAERLEALDVTANLDSVIARFESDDELELELELESWGDVLAAAKAGANIDQLAELRRGYGAAIEPLDRHRLATALGWESEGRS